MLDKFYRMVGIVSPRRQLNELKAFVDQYVESDTEDLVPLAAKVAGYRTLFESKNIRVGEPVEYLTEKPAIMTRMEDFVRDMSKTADELDIEAAHVWLYTLRAANAIAKNSKEADEFRQLATDMWKQLRQAAPDTPDPAFEPDVFSS